MKTRIFIQATVLIALIYIGLWSFSAQQEIWASKRPNHYTLHINGEYVDMHYHQGWFDVGVKGEK